MTEPFSWRFAGGVLSVTWNEKVAGLGGDFAAQAVGRIERLQQQGAADKLQLFLAGLFICAAASEKGLLTFQDKPEIDCLIDVQIHLNLGRATGG